MAEELLAPLAGLPHKAEAEAHEVEEEGSRLLGVLRGKAISLGTMEPALRRLTLAALVVIVLAALLVAVRDLPQPSLNVYSDPDTKGLLAMPALSFAACLVFLVIAWSFLLAGALHAHGLLRFAGLALYSFGMYVVMPKYGPAQALGWLLLLGAWVLGIVLWLRDRHHRRHAAERSHQHHLQLPTFAAYLGLTGLLFVLSLVGSGSATLLFTTAVTLQLLSLSLLLIPVLFLAGTDFAEWGEVAASRLVELAASRLPAAGLAAGLAAVALLELGDEVRQLHAGALRQLLPGALAVLVAAGLIALLRNRRPGPHVPFAAMATAALLTIGLFFGYAVVTVATASKGRAAEKAPANPILGQGMQSYAHEKDPVYSLKYPATWKIATSDDEAGLDLVVFDGLSTGDPALFTLVSVPAAKESDASQAFSDWLAASKSGPADLEPRPAEKGWQVGDFVLHHTGSDLYGTEWARVEGGRLWLLYGQTSKAGVELNQPVFEAIVESFHAGAVTVPDAPVAEASPRPAPGRAMAVAPVAWLLLALVLVAYLGWRRPAGSRANGALYLAVTGFFVCLAGSDSLTALPGLGWLKLPGFRIGGLESAAALVALAAVGVLAARRRLAQEAWLLRLLLVLLLSLQVLSWLYGLYSQAMSAGARFSVVQAVLIMAALFWDVVMSGESITNREGRHVPRHARVLIFFGYTLLVGCAVLFFSSLHVSSSGQGLESQFESEFWPQTGLLLLGMPLLVSLFVIKSLRSRRAAE